MWVRPSTTASRGIIYVAGDHEAPGFGVHEGQLERLRELCGRPRGGALGLFLLEALQPSAPL